MSNLKYLTFIFILIFASPAYSGQEEYSSMSIEELKNSASELHPSGLYLLAGKLFKENKKEEAVFWFYAGQIRFRFHIMANPDLEPSGDPALFNSMNHVLGQPINQYAGKDIGKWLENIEKAKKWDAENENSTTSKEEHSEVYAQVLTGLEQMVSQLERMKKRAQ